MRLSIASDKVSVFIVVLQICYTLSENLNHQHRQWADSDSAHSNVSCIAHDTKYSCDCRNVNQYMTLPVLYGHVYQIEISNCKHMVIRANALDNTQSLRTVIFKKIENLILAQNSLFFSTYISNTPLIIEFREVKIEIIESHAINGNIGEISFIDSYIETIRPFAFTTLKDQSMLLKMDGVVVNRIEPQALKKFNIEQIEIVNSEFLSDVPSKSFYELEVMSVLRIQNVTFRKVHTRALSFKGVKKLSIINNTFGQTESEWIMAEIKDKALIKSNNFGVTNPIAFRAIEVSRDVKFQDRVELQLVDNTIQFLNEPRALIFNDKIQVLISHLQYRNQFPCNDLLDNRPKTKFFRSNLDNIYFETKTNNQSLVLSKIINQDCQEKSYLLYIIIGAVVLVLICSILVAIVIARIINKRKKRKLDVVMPEPRTYKETQIIYQIENAGLLKTDL